MISKPLTLKDLENCRESLNLKCISSGKSHEWSVDKY